MWSRPRKFALRGGSFYVFAGIILLSASDGAVPPTRFEGLRRFKGSLHQPGSRARLFALIVMREFRAHCDESETLGSAFAIAGYIAPAAAWDELESAWEDALVDESISEFHAYPCVNGKDEFKGKSREERRRIEDRFICLLSDAPIQGFVSVIDLAAYDDLAAEFVELRVEGYWRAYLLAFQHQVEQMAAWLGSEGVERDEKVAFLFDRNDAFNVTALNLFNSCQTVGSWVCLASALGGVS
jgi:hypothetical protein